MNRCHSCESNPHVAGCPYVEFLGAPMQEPEVRFQLWHGPETGEVHRINSYADEGTAKRNGEMLAQMLPRSEHVFVTCLEPEDGDDAEGLYTLEYDVVRDEWSGAEDSP